MQIEFHFELWHQSFITREWLLFKLFYIFTWTFRYDIGFKKPGCSNLVICLLGVTYPSGALQKQLLDQVYQEANINPADVVYVEAHGTGTKAGDPEELNSLTSVFCDKRAPETGPLLIGSVKSNMGHPEPASGLCGVTKVLLAMQHGILPPNLHFNSPNPDIPGLLDGRLKVGDSSLSKPYSVNPLHPNISIYILHTLLCMFPNILTRRSC